MHRYVRRGVNCVHSSPLVGVDFQSQSLPVVFPATQQQILDSMNNLTVPERLSRPTPTSPPICINVSIIDDDILEQVDTKSFHLNLSHPDTAVVFSAPLSAEVIVTDDDSKLWAVYDPDSIQLLLN